MKKIKYYFVLLVLSTFVSCEKYLDIEAPSNKLETSSVFSDSTSTSLAILGIYSDMIGSNSGFIASQVRWAGFSADELDWAGTSTTMIPFVDNNLSSDDANVNSLWNNIYKHIYQSNSIIEGVENSTTISLSTKDSLIGEARFIRAFLLFYLVNNWGDVPLIVNTDYRINSILPRTPKPEVYEQIIEDLKYAEASLSHQLAVERTRPNKDAAKALLSRVYLYIENWQEAERIASELISLTEYSPLPQLDDVFIKESKETIWQLYSATLGSLYDTYDGFFFVPSQLTGPVIPNYLLRSNLFDSFETNDKRRDTWIGKKGIIEEYYFPYKYKVKNAIPNATHKEYTIILRLAEQYLIRAEARVHLGNSKGAIEDLNVVRTRAGLPNLISDLNNNDLLQVVEYERQHEFFCEWGHRWYDLKRTYRADAILGSLKGDKWQPTDALWPIPLNQLLTNTSLIQNDGY